MKYVGSKAKLSKYIVPILQDYIDKNEIKSYIEPFVGGANIIDKIECESKIGIDIDPLVIDLHRINAINPCFLDYLPKSVSKELYYDVRDNKEAGYPNWYRSAILFFASYNSRVYGGCYGASAITKNGKIRNYYLEALNNYRKQMPFLKDIKFLCKDYKELKAKNCLVYCDPPYSEGIGYSQKFDSKEFWEWCRQMSKDNIVVISEYSAPSDFECIWETSVKTHMNNRNKLQKTERLFVYKGRVANEH